MRTMDYYRPIESADEATADEVVWTHHDGSLFAGPKAWVDEFLHRFGDHPDPNFDPEEANR